MKVSVVIAAYDERDNVEELTRRLDGVLSKLSGVDFEMVFAVEGRDGTKEVLEGLARELGRIHVLYSEEPQGLGNAFRRAFAAAAPDSDLVVTMDADLNHDPEEIPRLLDEIQRHALDVAVGSRFVDGSQSDGIPIWKWSLSILMNRLIASLFDVEVRDKTSGFRVYRAAALQKLIGYRNDDYAFLPEILIAATQMGLRIGEFPIHFKFRTRGESKMSIGQTSRSYLRLLRSRFDRWTVAALAALAAGTLVRVLYAFPVHKFVPDADSLLSGLRAIDILHGKPRVFYSYVRIGALESYFHVVAFLALGVTRTAVSIAPLLTGVLTLLAFFFLIRELFGREPACFALVVFGVGSPAYLAWTYMPNGYPETMLFCVTTLYFAARLGRTGLRPISVIAFGLCAGLGFWNSLQTLVCTLPAVLWLLFVRRNDMLRHIRLLLVGLAAWIVGASPWIAYNLRYSFPSLKENFAARPAHGLAEAFSNTTYLFRYNVRELSIGMNPLFGGKPLNFVEAALVWPAAAVYAIAILAFLVFPVWFRRRSGEPPGRLPRASFALLWAVAITICGLYVFSEPGETRGLTVRYVLPLFIVLAAALGVLGSLAWKLSRIACISTLLMLLLFNVSGYYMPWTSQRHYLSDLAGYDEEVVHFLEANQVRWVCGNYWVVYPLAFVSQERVLPLPFLSIIDHYQYVRRLPENPVPWAIVARNPVWLRRWVARANLRGGVARVGRGYFVFRPDPEEESHSSPQATLNLLRRTATWGH